MNTLLILVTLFLASELIAVCVWYLVTKYKIESNKPRQYATVKSVACVENVELVLN